MSHQSGIRPSPELIQTFSKAGQSTRAIQVIISDETLVANETINTSSNFENDFSTFQSWLTPTAPCFVLYRMDTLTKTGDYDWLILQYVPDNAKVRDKMLYAASRATLTKELGDAKFVDSLYGTTPAEFTLDGYRKHVAAKNAEAPRTEREMEMARVKLAESGEMGSSVRKTLVASGVSFSWSADASKRLQEFKSKGINLLQLKIDEESIETDRADISSPSDISANVSTTSPRFVLYRYKNPGDSSDATIFVYVCPGASKVKERMLYSSTRGNVIQVIEESLGALGKKVEIDDPSEIQPEWLEDFLFPKVETSTTSKSFAKPKGPGGARGATRLTKVGV
ncbi:hypothetical protein SmJEL517_g02474 [Synchytrium microbalum]|uniref:Twinfilin n=1 Tax=Synchytrium microbalum TaxID=1806994 RepID=A0A507C6X8_9FUNG|nr:uncharacterized protein SmJEL517_g02474 [Synchytrium microbalum]TPX35098.1 hypothetical protein SmJEL517_g02474 [Synchytrium microbalum]